MTVQDRQALSVLKAGLAAIPVADPERVGAGLLEYVRLLGRWNRRFNLTGTRAPADIVRRHVLDSLTVAPHLSGDRVLDAGTGAGLPGLVLAIARPEIRYTLLDSVGKKTRFCLQAKAELSLANVEVVRDRLERFEPQVPFSCVVSRAFIDGPELVEKTRRLLAPGGVVLAMKGGYPTRDLEDLACRGLSAEVIPLSVPGLGEARHLLIVRP
ncbi:MAG: 16S rRNA (guanine(527)-N(7))-methyltransferase RsmG [Gammaproteobacteria bacterium]|nr:16S rRNA (guanine(527)-N(7))-methyltransferase RsmG [Gammaproteobacteria bacterium]